MRAHLILACATLIAASGADAEGSGTYSVRLLTPETAQKAVNAAMADCRKRGFQVSVAVVDRAGVVQALLRDRFAGPHTPQTAINKAYTAVSFRQETTDLARNTQSGQPGSGIRHIPNVVAVGGGVQIQASGANVGAIGVSGAPGGDQDDLCAKAGIAAIRDELEL